MLSEEAIDKYKEFLKQWQDVAENGSDEWEAIIDKDSNYKLLKKDEFSK